MTQAESVHLPPSVDENKRNKQNKQNGLFNHHAKKPDIQIMKKAILTEIADLNEQDLDVMEEAQIVNFYNQLINSKQDNQPAQSNKKESSQKVGENNQKPVKQDEIIIKGSIYRRASYPQQPIYKLINNRLIISCGPWINQTEQRRKALKSCYNPSMKEIISSMKESQINETYERLRIPTNKNEFIIDPSSQLKQSQFCLYLNKVKIDQAFIQKLKINQAKSVNSQENKSNEYNNNKAQKVREVEQCQKQQKQVQQNNAACHDQFFDQLNQNISPKSNSVSQAFKQKDVKSDKQKQKETKDIQQKKFEKKNVRIQPSLKQTIQSAKAKDKKQNGVQTQKINQPRKTKTQLTVVSQVQYIQESQDQDQVLQPRKRPLSQIDQKQNILGELPRKITSQQFQNALLNPGKEPEPTVLSWITKMKSLVIKLQDKYLGLFGSQKQWKVINY